MLIRSDKYSPLRRRREKKNFLKPWALQKERFWSANLLRLGSIYENFIHIVSVKMTDFHLLFGKQLSQINTNSSLREWHQIVNLLGETEGTQYFIMIMLWVTSNAKNDKCFASLYRGGGVSFCDLYLAKLKQKAHIYKHKPGQILASHLCHCKWCNDLKWSSPRHEIHLGPRQWLKELWCG